MRANEFISENVAEGLYDADPATYDLPRRPLNVPELIRRGAIFVVDPHGETGWEDDADGFSLVTLWNVAKGGWPAEAKQHLKPSMYKVAESGLNRQGPGSMLYDGKYRQILWSIKKLGLPDEVAFLDQVKENFADGKKPGRKGLAKRVGVPTKASVSKLRQIAKHSTGEKARMAHWMANMKAGKQKKNESEMDEGWKQNVAAGVLGAGMALGSGASQADTDVFNKKFTPAEIQQIQTKADLTQRYYNELVRRAKEDGRIMDRTTLNMLKAQAEDAAARSVQQRPQAPQAKSALPGTQPSEIRRSKNYDNFEEGWKSAVGGAALAGAVALGGAGAYQAKNSSPVVGPTSVIQQIQSGKIQNQKDLESALSKSSAQTQLFTYKILQKTAGQQVPELEFSDNIDAMIKVIKNKGSAPRASASASTPQYQPQSFVQKPTNNFESVSRKIK